MYLNFIRNFCIIAHIDHGKSTLADRLLEETKTISERDLKAQVLDDLEPERERGITIKSHAIRMNYNAKDTNNYIFNLIDTPGHVDFSYEVSRSLAACEGALLVVDAAQGVEAQTISNLYMAVENDLTIIPVLNKVDLPSAEIENVTHQIIELIGCEEEEIIHASAKAGIGIEEILESIIVKIPAPKGDADEKLQALLFDSLFDSYRGAIAFIRVFNGTLKKNDLIKFFSTRQEHTADEIGILKLSREPVKELKAGEVGYLITGVKDVRETKVGDTLTHVRNPADKALAGYKEVKPMVYSGIYPIMSEDFEGLLVSRLGSSEYCPHGMPMGLETQMDRRKRGWLPLNEADNGAHVTVRNVFERDRELLEYLDGLAVRPGAEFDVMAQNVDETVSLRINGNTIQLGRAAASRIWVEPSDGAA